LSADYLSAILPQWWNPSKHILPRKMLFFLLLMLLFRSVCISFLLRKFCCSKILQDVYTSRIFDTILLCLFLKISILVYKKKTKLKNQCIMANVVVTSSQPVMNSAPSPHPGKKYVKVYQALGVSRSWFLRKRFVGLFLKRLCAVCRPIYTEELPGVAAHDSLCVLLRRVILYSCTARQGNSWAWLNKQRIVRGYSWQLFSVDWP